MSEEFNQETEREKSRKFMEDNKPKSTILQCSKEQAEAIKKILLQNKKEEIAQESAPFNPEQAQTMKELAKELKVQIRNEVEQEFKEKLEKEGGKGTLGMSPEMLRTEQGKHEQEFDSPLEALIWAKKNDPEAYQKIKEKTYAGIAENRTAFSWKDPFDEGKSLIRHILDENNRRNRGE